jgi:Transposase DDE domain
MAGVQKAPGHEVGGNWVAAAQRALWGFDVYAEFAMGALLTLSPALRASIQVASPQCRATPEYAEACRRRKKVEMLFAHLKRILCLTRLRLRGPNGARDEFLLAATAQNLRRLARLRPTIELPDAMAA